MVLGIFEIALRFCVAITGNFESFEYFSFITNFLENENLFKKTESTKVENASFSCKTAMSETNVKTNRMGSTNRTYLLYIFNLI